MIKVTVKNLQNEVVASSNFATQELAEAYVAEQTASQSVCLWGKLAWVETILTGDFDQSGFPITDTVNHPQEFTVEYSDSTAEAQLNFAKASYKSAKAFGEELITNFSVENAIIGITTEDSNALLGKLNSVLTALAGGYLETAMARVREIPLVDYDGVYVTAPRLLSYVNAIETYLGFPISTEL